MSPLRSNGDGRPRRGALVRVVAAVILALACFLAWTALAGGAQPYETYEATVAGDGPVAQFRFDDPSGSGTIADSVGSYTALNSGIVLGGEGPFGGSKSGSLGGEAYASLPSSPLVGAGEFTVEGWVDWTGGTSYEQAVFDFGSSTTDYMYLTPSGGSKHLLLFEIRTGAGTDVQVTAPKLVAKKWEYVAVTETSSGTLTLYLNGEHVGQVTGATIFPSSLGSVANDYLGKSQVSTAPLFNGSMSNVAFYDKALSASQIEAHYDAGEYPVNTVAPTISGTARDGSVLTGGKGTWIGLAPITYSYQWMLCNTSGEACASIAAATATKYTLGHEDVGRTLRVAVTGTNGEGASTASSAPTATIEALKPSNTELPVISGMAESGQLLAVSTGGWEGTPPFSYAYQWQKCNSSGEGCANISGATASSYRILNSQVGDTLRALVTASNAAGSVKADSVTTATITAGPPANTELSVISGTAEEGHTLSASTGAWAGTEPFSYTYQWQGCNSAGESCSNISAATSSTYSLTSSNVGSTLRIVVTAKDSVGSTEATSLASAVVVGPPVNNSAPSISGTAQDGQTLTASTGVWEGTPPISYAYQWELCNSSGEGCSGISGATGSTYAPGHSDVGMTLRVVVTATNSVGSAESTSGASGVVAALAPSNTAVPAISGTAEEGQTLTVSTGSWEGTPTISYTYQWQSCDSLGEGCMDISGATGATYLLGPGDVGGTLRVLVTAKNSAGSASTTSPASTVVVGLPVSTAAPAISGTAQDGQTLSASTGAWEGTPPISYAYQWEFCNSSGGACSDISGATGSTYVLDGDVGMTLRVVVIATNSVGAAESASEASSVVTASAPSNTALPTISGTAEEGQVLSASPGSWEGTPTISYAYQWQDCDSLGEGCMGISGATGSSYTLQAGDVGSTLRVVVTASNAGGSASVSSGASGVVVAGLPPSLIYASQFGSAGSGAGQFDGPEGIAIDARGNVWVSDTYNGRVEEFNDKGEYVRTVGSKGSGAGQIGESEGIAVDSKGDVWIADWANSRVEEFNEQGEYLKEFGSYGSGDGQFSGAFGIAVSPGGDVWVGDVRNERIEEFNEAGDYIGQFGSSGSGAGQFSLGDPMGLAVDSKGDVWVTDSNNNRLEEFTEKGEYMRTVGSTGSGDGQFYHPGDVAIDASGDVWVADTYNDRVEEFSEAGEYLSQVGSEGSGDAQLNDPFGVAIGAHGEVWVLDTGNNRVEEWALGVPKAPSSTEVPSVSGEVVAGYTLSASTGGWDGTPPISYAYAWQSCNSHGEECADIEGASEQEYQLGTGDVGTTLRVVVTASNAVGSTVATSSPTAVVAPATPPADILPPVIIGTAREGRMLSASVGEWAGNPYPTFTYQWQRCSEVGTECTDIEGAEGEEYELTEVDTTHTLRVVVTATNVGGVASESSSQTAVVERIFPPSNTALPSISGLPDNGQTLTASSGSWTGTEPIFYTYQWQRCDSAGENCTSISSATSSSYRIGAANLGSTLRVEVTASNLLGSASATSPATTTVVAIAPTCTVVWTGEAGDGSWSDPRNWSTRQVPSAGDTACINAGTTVNITSGSNSVGQLEDEGSLVLSGGSLELAAPSTSNIGSLTVRNATLTGPGSVFVSGSFTLGAYGSMSGSGETIVGPSALGEIYASSGCEPMTLNERRFVNEGTLGFWWGTLLMSGGAELENEGTFEDDTEAICYSSQIQSSGGVEPSFLNRGMFEKTAARGTSTVAVSFTNQGVVEAQTGSLVFSGGGIPQEVAYGAWAAQRGASLVFSAGTFWIGEDVDLSAVYKDGATVELGADTGPPVSSIAPAISGEPRVGQALRARAGRWKGTRPLSYSYQWQRCNAEGEDCAEIVGASAPTYLLTPADDESGLRVTVTATNDEGDASSTSQATSVVSFPPINASPPMLSGTAQAEQTLSASTGSWEGGSPISYTYQWQSCGEESGGGGGGGGGAPDVLTRGFAVPLVASGYGRSCVNISGATGATYTLQNSDVEETVRVVVTAKDEDGEASVASAESETVLPAGPPENVVLPSISGTVQEGQTLEAGVGVWQSPGATSYAYQWQLCDGSGEACANIEGATEPTYVPEIPDLDGTLRVTVTATGVVGSASATSEPSAATTQAPPPTLEGAPAISGAPKDGRTLTASTGSWETPFPLTYTYQWQRCSGANEETCSDIEGATSETYTPSSADPPDSYLRVVVTATNIYEASSSSTSATSFIPRAVRVTEYSYDANGNLQSRTDGSGHTTTYTYGPGNEQTKVTEPDGTTTETGYDADGRVTSQTDGDKHTTKYTRNVLGEVTEVTDPLGRKTIKEYDPTGNLTSVTDPEGRTTSYSYDDANRLTEVSYSDGKTPAVKYEYDADGNRTKMTDGTGTSTYSYDPLDELTETTDGHGDTIGYEYNLAGQQTKVTYPGNKPVERSYDEDGRLSSVKDWLGNETSFAYDPDSNLVATTFPEGTGETDHYAYNDADEMSEASFGKGSERLASLSYSREEEGQVAGTVSKGLPGEETAGYTYDENSQLTKAGSTAYEYDAAGNPTNTAGSTNVYDAADQLEHSSGASYTYDEMGERTKTTPSTGPATSYGYDQAGNLISVERPEEGATPAIEDSYAYNGEDLRTSQTINGTTSYLTWDMTEELPLILSDETDSYVYGPDNMPIEQINNSTGVVTYLHHDQQGSTRLLTGSTGTVTGKCTYGAYGTPTCEGTATTPLGYDAQYTSSDTGLIYMRARVYDPSTAQFLSVDPLKATTGAPYYYAGDNPLNEADPTGLGNWLNLGIPSPGEVAEKLNPVKYYEEEIESYENGCGYFASVAHGLEGAVVGTLDASGIGGLAEGAAGLAGEEGSTAIEDALAGLEPGSSPGVYTVDSSEELQQIYDELSAGGKPTGSSYPGEEVELSNGTRVGIREASKSGGPTIDINQGGTQYKIHVAE